MTLQAPTVEQKDVLFRNVAELQQREKARELGAGLVLQLYRLVRVTQFHAVDNMAVLQQTEQTLEAIRLFAQQTTERPAILFSRGTVFVAGQLLKATRSEYESALELGAMLEKLGLNQIVIDPDATVEDIHALVRAIRTPPRDDVSPEPVVRPSPHVRLSRVSSALFGADDDTLSEDEQVIRTYATSVVVMRDVFDNLAAGRFELPHQAKRLAQKLVTLSAGDTPAFLGVTAMRNANHDAAGRAVNTAILAVAMARQLSDDNAILARIAMSALLHDVGRPLLVGRTEAGIEVGLDEHDRRRLPAATALVLTTLGQLREASMVRSVIAYEAQWRRRRRGEPLYEGRRQASIGARIVAAAHRFNELLTLDPGADRPLTPDEAIQSLYAEATGPNDRAIIALLVGAVGIFPSGTPVELTTGERGVVVSTPDHPADYVRPTVQLVYDSNGEALRKSVLVDLTTDAARRVERVLPDPDERLRTVCEGIVALRRPLGHSVGPSATREVPATTPPNQARAPTSLKPSAAPIAKRPSAQPQATSSRPVHASGSPARRSAAPSAPQAVEPVARSRIAPAGSAPMARGSLEKTPFAQLFVFVKDRALTGTLILTEADSEPAIEHAIYVEGGNFVRLRTTSLEASPGATLSTRVIELFGVPHETEYAFYADVDLARSNDPEEVTEGSIDALRVLAAGIRAHPYDSGMDRLLVRLGVHAIQLRPDLRLAEFEFDTAELAVAELIDRHAPTLSELLNAVDDGDVARRVLYTLMLTRSIEIAER